MPNILDKISPINEDKSLNVFIEIQKDSKNKYELDKATGLIKLDRVLYSAQGYPFDYGFIPNTLWHDGDPLDVVVLSSSPIHSGVLVEVRAVGYINMVDSGESDAKIIGVPVNDPRFDKIQKLSDVNPHTLKEIQHFFETYKNLQNKVVTIPGIHDQEEAEKVIQESIELYKNKKN